MAITMRSMLEKIRKEIEQNPALLDAPCISSHSASGEYEAVYGPYVKEEPSETLLDYMEGDVDEGKPYWSFVIDH